ncbi:MAG: phage tail protein [Deltaproteobacteria bacterium]|nr:phage tail protein [Deltaproteobacteria bacterium]
MEPFIGMIVMFGGNFAPRGWALCDGQLLAINSYSALFSVLGTAYGGDGRTTFGLPDLRGRVPIHPGSGPGLSSRRLGEAGGQENVWLTANQMPSHTHAVQQNCSSEKGLSSRPEGNYPAVTAGASYAESSDGQMGTDVVNNTGGDQSHSNVQPFRCVNYIIALQGTYPSRN